VRCYLGSFRVGLRPTLYIHGLGFALAQFVCNEAFDVAQLYQLLEVQPSHHM
jgi:hypothetical protein